MVTTMVTKVYTSVTEVYDLHTQVGKIGLIGIHTPTMANIQNHYTGLMMNFKFLKLLGCDINLACASVLPMDPLQLGFEAGQQMDPRDLFNPLLYTAVSNDSMNTLVSTIYEETGNTPLQGDSVNYLEDALSGTYESEDDLQETVKVTADPYKVYYSLLSSEGFRKAMPQAGLRMSNLIPLVHPVATTKAIAYDGQLNPLTAIKDGIPARQQSWDPSDKSRNFAISLKPVPMPAINCSQVYQDSVGTNPNDVEQQYPSACPPCYVGAIITPPSYSQQLYYRMTVTWKLCFMDLRDGFDTMSVNMLQDLSEQLYKTDYETQSATMALRGGSVDVSAGSLEPVMTKVI